MPAKKLLDLLRPQPRYTSRPSYNDLINAESRIGRTLFGPIPEGHQREFFQSKKNVWIWYEGFMDPEGVMQGMTIRYEVRPTGVFKQVSGRGFQKIQGSELDNFRNAAKRYLELVKNNLYT